VVPPGDTGAHDASRAVGEGTPGEVHRPTSAGGCGRRTDLDFEEGSNPKRGERPASKPDAAAARRDPKGPAGNGEGRTGWGRTDQTRHSQPHEPLNGSLTSRKSGRATRSTTPPSGS